MERGFNARLRLEPQPPHQQRFHPRDSLRVAARVKHRLFKLLLQVSLDRFERDDLAGRLLLRKPQEWTSAAGAKPHAESAHAAGWFNASELIHLAHQEHAGLLLDAAIHMDTLKAIRQV